MKKSQTSGKGLGQKVVKSVASIARSVAIDGIDGRCWLFMHQPKEPKNLAERLAVMKSR